MNSVYIVFGVESGESDLVLGTFEGTPEGLLEAMKLVDNLEKVKYYTEDFYTIHHYPLPYTRKKPNTGEEVIYRSED